MKIKCGRNEYELKNGDYLLDNGCCYQFVPKDNYFLPFKDWNKLTSIRMSKKEFNRLKNLPNFKIKRGTESKALYYFWNE